MRKAFKLAQTEKPGVSFIDFPENIAEMEVDEAAARRCRARHAAARRRDKIAEAADIISRRRSIR